jgi:hypothetical protein
LHSLLHPMGLLLWGNLLRLLLRLLRLHIAGREPSLAATETSPPPGTVLTRSSLNDGPRRKGQLRLPRVALEGMLRHKRNHGNDTNLRTYSTGDRQSLLGRAAGRDDDQRSSAG